MAIWTFGVNFIARTEAFMRDTAKVRESLEGISGETKKFGSTMNQLKSALRMGAFTYTANSILDMATAMLKARRQGESMTDAFLAHIPIINRMARAANDLANELSGLAAVQETAGRATTMRKGMDELSSEMERSILLAQADQSQTIELKGKFNYQDRLKQIDALESEAAAIRKHNAALDEQINKLKKQQETARGQQIGFGMVGGGVPPSAAELQQRIDTLESQKFVERNLETLRIQAQREYEANANKQVEAEKQKIEKINRIEFERVSLWQEYQATLRDDMEHWTIFVEDRYGEMTYNIEGATGNMFANMMQHGAKWRDVMANFFNDVAVAASQMAGQTAARGIFGAILGGGAGAGMVPAGTSAAGGGNPYFLHEGGIVGEGGGIRGNMPASAFMMAPRFHSGLRADEFTAVLKRGEEVIPPGGRRGGMTINVQTPDVTATQRWLWNNRHSIADMMMGAGRENNKVRRTER